MNLLWSERERQMHYLTIAFSYILNHNEDHRVNKKNKFLLIYQHVIGIGVNFFNRELTTSSFIKAMFEASQLII